MARWADSFATGRVLKVVAPDGQERTIQLEGGEMQIGSSLDSTLVLAGHGVSAKHCRLSPRGEALVLVDRGSRNGTYINSRKITEPTEIKVGDRIAVGAYILEILPARDQVDARHVEARMRVAEVKLGRGEEERRAVEREKIGRYARQWEAAARPRRLLLHQRELATVLAWPPEERAQDPLIAAILEATLKARKLRLILGLGSLGASVAAALIAWRVLGGGSSAATAGDGPVAVADAATTAGEAAPDRDPEPPSKSVKFVEHTVQTSETWEDIAHYYGVSPATLSTFNAISLSETPIVGTKLRVPSSKPPRPPLVEECYTTTPGDDWRTIADYYATTTEALRRQNKKVGDQLRGNEQLCFLVESEPFAARTPNPDDLPIFIVPEGAESVGKVTGGALRNAVQLLPNPLCQLRCSMHAFATNHTIKVLLGGISDFRAQGYKGDIMIGDLSRKEGGQYGPHKSHQSGRDADIWLLVKGGEYKLGCNNCSTKKCRPDPPEVDWAAQWRFIKALDATGQVQEIFLSDWLQPELHKAAKAQGATPEELKRMIQYPKKPGWPALVMHSDGHIHHIHVRFKCAPDDVACSNAK
ncbi:MAG: penicillin-insensitive murein endopeptidase [Myxococcales bacterium]|nr:penicillin-insensitive murein endopeptidase [Myxococcales bacterium]